MQQSSHKYSSYHKSFNRAFSTRQDKDVQDYEETRLPPLQANETLRMPLCSDCKTENENDRKMKKSRAKSRPDNLRDIHLNPVIIHGANGLKIDGNRRVRLPPIKVNMHVRTFKELETVDKNPELSHNDSNESRKHNGEIRRDFVNISSNETSTRERDNFQGLENRIAQSFPKCTNTAPAMSKARITYNKTGIIERQISIKEYKVLPPIGKRVSAQEKEEEEAKKVADEESKQEKKPNHEEKKLGLEEALENLAHDYEMIKGIKSKETKAKNEQNVDKKPKKTETALAKKQQLEAHEEVGTFTAIDDTLKMPKGVEKNSTEPDNKMDSKRTRQYYKDVRIEDDNERKYIKKVRKHGRRYAICEEMDSMYRDLAVLVKHNLLIQHLEEICLF